jgi:uncharacterized membrane protein
MANLIEILTNIFSHVCHQIPERSFLIYGGKSILCARCTGMYLGVFVGVLSIIFINKISNTRIFKMILISVLIVLLEIYGEKIQIAFFGNIVRFTTGILLGVSVGLGIAMSTKKIIGGHQ